MNRPKKTLTMMEQELYVRDTWCWAIYTALRHAPGKPEKATLWGMLTKDQQEALKILARHV